MIVGEDWIWLHFPKCGGTSAEALLRMNFADNREIKFDQVNPENMIWHDNIRQRQERDPSFSAEGKRIIAIFRRLPDWLLSRVHFEASRPPHWLVSRAEMIEGKFYENSGYVNNAEAVFNLYNETRVTDWLRVEHLHEDFERFFSMKLLPLEKKLNESKFGYIRDTSFWFTKQELENLYHLAPNWAETEKRIYGNLLV